MNEWDLRGNSSCATDWRFNGPGNFPSNETVSLRRRMSSVNSAHTKALRPTVTGVYPTTREGREGQSAPVRLYTRMVSVHRIKQRQPPQRSKLEGSQTQRGMAVSNLPSGGGSVMQPLEQDTMVIHGERPRVHCSLLRAGRKDLRRSCRGSQSVRIFEHSVEHQVSDSGLALAISASAEPSSIQSVRQSYAH